MAKKNSGVINLLVTPDSQAISPSAYMPTEEWPVENQGGMGSQKINNTTVFLRHVYLEGALNEGQRQRMVQIANSCPVHKTLTSPIEVKTELL